MFIKKYLFISLLGVAGSLAVMAQPKTTAKKVLKMDSASMALLKPQKSITRGTVTVKGRAINYKAVAGRLKKLNIALCRSTVLPHL